MNKIKIAVILVIVLIGAFGVWYMGQSPWGSVVSQPKDDSTERGESPTVFHGQGFEVTLPPGWHENPDVPGELRLEGNNSYILGYEVTELTKENIDSTLVALYQQGKIIEAERMITEALCGQTDVCTTIVSSLPLTLNNNIGAKIVIRHNGIRVDEPRGVTNGEYYTFVKNNKLYHFSTIEIVAPEELQKEYPRLDPSPLRVFEDIMATLELSL